MSQGDKTNPGNYRPISILPTISISCQTALTKITEAWLKEMDQGNITGVIFLDFRKAFDLVNHEILLEKLRLYDFDQRSLHWIKSYLHNRFQSVNIGNVKSCNLPIKRGVPQGSVLGPLLFLIYINDLPLHVQHSNVDIFADDTTVHKASPSLQILENGLNHDIQRVQTWCAENHMIINENKTTCMLIGTKQKLSKLSNSTLAINVNDMPIENVDNERLLGVRLDNSLHYTKHIDDVCRSLSSKVALLNRIKQFLPLHYRKMYFNAYILPSIDYCLTIWGNAPKCHLNRILKFQKYAARLILDAPPDSPS